MLSRVARVLVVVLFVSAIGGCGFKAEADKKFGDQHFKTAIALIELHKLRTGSYPPSLRDLRFTGNWDAIATESVRYERTGSGYSLHLVRGWVGSAELSYPPEFWHVLGIVSSNVGGLAARPGGS